MLGKSWLTEVGKIFLVGEANLNVPMQRKLEAFRFIF